ncbi:hypothetical protein Tco_1248243 [Tanacetum coccineum]
MASIRGKKCVLFSPLFFSFLSSSLLLSYGDGLYAFNLLCFHSEAIQFVVVGFFCFFLSSDSDSTSSSTSASTSTSSMKLHHSF